MSTAAFVAILIPCAVVLVLGARIVIRAWRKSAHER